MDNKFFEKPILNSPYGYPPRYWELDGQGQAEGGQVRANVNSVDVFHPNTGEVRSDDAEGIACWFIDTDYNSRWRSPIECVGILA